MAQAQTQNAETQAHGGAPDVGFPPFDTSTYGGQILWLAITFGALYFLMSRVLVPQLSGIIENRRQVIAGDLDEAAAMKQRAEEAGASYEKALAEARGRAQTLAQETRDKLGAETDARRKGLEADLNARLAAAEAEISAKKSAALGNVRGIARDTTVAIVERLTGRAPALESVDAALDRANA